MLYVSIIIFSALLYTYYHFRDRVPILMYHRIASVPGDRNALPVEKFEEQMRYLEENGFHSITMEELQAHFLHGKRLPKKPVVLTFDDGYEDNFSAALPILKKYRHVGNVFPIANWIGRENKWENFGKAPTRTMDERELALWQNEGHYVGSHTMDHPFLSRCGTDRLHDELSESKRFLKNLMGSRWNVFAILTEILTERSCRRRRSAGINWGWRFSMMSRCGHRICLPCPAFRFLPGSRCGNLN